MKQLIFMSALTLASALTGEAMAACSGAQVLDTAGTHETANTAFTGLTNGQWVTVGGLTFTATGTRTNAQVAGAYANLGNGATSGPATGLGTYSGTLTGWTTGAATGTPAANKVLFTNVAYGNVTNITLVGSTGTVKPSASTTDGTGTGIALGTLLTGNTVCVGSAGNWQAQEFHKSGSDLIDWKKGGSDPIDPRKSVGSWSITGTGAAARVNYNYGVAPIYNDAVWDHGDGTYSFCDQNNNETIASSIKSGQVSCQ